ncbi:hypothetical protein [Streptomyces sp. NPDC058542]|uniref:hypothetical protein n=1 Tax=Streptomyces sp. NPDC058542 TaxID=3346543 RepID=UPI00365305EE
MNSSFPRNRTARGPGPRWADPGGLLVPAAAAFGALSLVGWWWGLPTAIAAFVAGRGPGRGRTVLLVLAGTLVAGAVAVAVAPSLLALGTRFVAVVVLAVLVPWFVGRFSRQYRELVRAGWQRAEQLEREKRLIAEQARRPRPGPSSTRATTPGCGWGRIGPTYGRCCRTGSRWSGRRAPGRRNEG